MESFNLNEWMDETGHTQASLAKALDVSRWTIKRIQDKGQASRTFVLACKALKAREAA